MTKPTPSPQAAPLVRLLSEFMALLAELGSSIYGGFYSLQAEPTAPSVSYFQRPKPYGAHYWSQFLQGNPDFMQGPETRRLVIVVEPLGRLPMGIREFLRGWGILKSAPSIEIEIRDGRIEFVHVISIPGSTSFNKGSSNDNLVAALDLLRTNIANLVGADRLREATTKAKRTLQAGRFR